MLSLLLVAPLLAPLVCGVCPPHPSPAHGDLVDSVWVPGALAIRCHYGLVPTGSGLAACEGDEWSEQLECEEAVALLLGGDEESGYSLAAELYHPSADCPEIPHLPQPTHGGSGGWVGGMAVICGGEPQPFAMTAECFGYSPQDNLWFELPGLKASRSMASGVVLDGALLVTGGYDADYYSTDVSELWLPGLDSPWVEQPSLPNTRSDHCSVSLATPDSLQVVVTGNFPEIGVPNINEAETSLLKIEEGLPVWSQLQDMSLGRTEHGCSQVSSDGGETVEVMVAGGPSSAECEIYNPVTDTWSEAASLPHTVYSAGMTVLEGSPTLMGGYAIEDPEHHRNQDDVFQYSAASDSWQQQKKLQTQRHAMLTIPVPRSLFCP